MHMKKFLLFVLVGCGTIWFFGVVQGDVILINTGDKVETVIERDPYLDDKREIARIEPGEQVVLRGKIRQVILETSHCSESTSYVEDGNTYEIYYETKPMGTYQGKPCFSVSGPNLRRVERE